VLTSRISVADILKTDLHKSNTNRSRSFHKYLCWLERVNGLKDDDEKVGTVRLGEGGGGTVVS